jgi:acyl-CoA thioester hydrolase
MKHLATIPVRYVDIDAMGHVNNAVYLNYFEQARMDFFENSIGENWDWKKDGIVLARNEVDYVSPIFLCKSVFIETELERIGTKSITLCYEVRKTAEAGSQVYARGKSVIVCFDYERGVTVAISERWKKAFGQAQ